MRFINWYKLIFDWFYKLMNWFKKNLSRNLRAQLKQIRREKNIKFHSLTSLKWKILKWVQANTSPLVAMHVEIMIYAIQMDNLNIYTVYANMCIDLFVLHFSITGLRTAWCSFNFPVVNIHVDWSFKMFC